MDTDKLLSLMGSVQQVSATAKTALKGFLCCHPTQVLITEGEKVERPHAATTLLCLEAAYELGMLANDDPPECLAPENVRSLVEAVIADPRNSTFLQDADNLFVKSALLRLANYSEHPERRSLASQLAASLKRHLASKPAGPNAYLMLLAVIALRPKGNPVSVSLGKRIARAALGELRDQLVYHSARVVLKFDVARLASAAALVSRLPSKALGLESDHLAMVQRAAEILLDSELGRDMRAPRPQVWNEDKSIVIHSAPWEELRIVAHLPLGLLPQEKPVLYNLVRQLRESVIDRPGRIGGWTASPTPGYPSPMSWITAMYGSLLVRVARLLRHSHTEGLLRSIERADPRQVERFQAGVVAKHVEAWANVLETSTHSRKIVEESLFPATPGAPPKARSLLLFGPPGTAKSTLVRGLAFKLQRHEMRASTKAEPWPLYTVNPADVLDERGFPGLITNLKGLFRRIRALSEVVVFFDEAENLMLGRDRDGESRYERMVTAAMLPLLNNIDAERIVFVVATNKISDLDGAIRRKGRFALRIGVGPPTEDARRTLLAGPLNAFAKMHPDTFENLIKWTDGFTIKEVARVGEIIGSLQNPSAVDCKKETDAMRKNIALSAEVREEFDKEVERFHDG